MSTMDSLANTPQNIHFIFHQRLRNNTLECVYYMYMYIDTYEQ